MGHGVAADREDDYRGSRLRTRAPGGLTFALALAAVAGDGGVHAATSAGAAAAAPAGITVRSTPAGTYLADAQRMALYTYAQDRPGKSVCNAECAKAWPPLAAPAGAAAAGDWSVIARDDGATQWAWRGRPLYRFAKDAAPDEVLGDRVGNAWRVAFDPVKLPPATAIRSTWLGRVLTDVRGRTLYWRDDEKPAGSEATASRCKDKCLDQWLPLAAPLLANRVGDWTPAPRDDGSRQWAYQGRRLYLHAADVKAGDALGQGLEHRWRAAVLEPMPALPAWVTVQNSDMSEIYADAKGLTLYTFGGSLEKAQQITCDAACVAKFWRTIPAAADAKPSGEWSLVPAPGGQGRIWAYKGNTLYTHTRDSAPGAVGGDKWAAGVGGGGGGFTPIQRRRDFEE